MRFGACALKSNGLILYHWHGFIAYQTGQTLHNGYHAIIKNICNIIH